MSVRLRTIKGVLFKGRSGTATDVILEQLIHDAWIIFCQRYIGLGLKPYNIDVSNFTQTQMTILLDVILDVARNRNLLLTKRHDGQQWFLDLEYNNVKL